MKVIKTARVSYDKLEYQLNRIGESKIISIQCYYNTQIQKEFFVIIYRE